MKLNTLKPNEGSRSAAKRVGRGIGSGLGKTGGRGHKGQKSRSGGNITAAFEGGQMPFQRRLPKRGFKSRVGLTTAEVRTSELARVDSEVIDMLSLKSAGLVPKNATRARIFLSGEINKALSVKGVAITKGAKSAIEAAGGSVDTAAE